MQCTPLRAFDHSSSSSDDDAPLLKTRISSQKNAIKKEKHKRATTANKKRIENAAIEGLHDLCPPFLSVHFLLVLAMLRSSSVSIT
jgi:hypothetical protein